MADHVYKCIELTGSSTTTIEDAVDLALKKAGETLHNLRWFEVVETRGTVDQNKVQYWQVRIKVGFTLD